MALITRIPTKRDPPIYRNNETNSASAGCAGAAADEATRRGSGACGISLCCSIHYVGCQTNLMLGILFKHFQLSPNVVWSGANQLGASDKSQPQIEHVVANKSKL